MTLKESCLLYANPFWDLSHIHPRFGTLAVWHKQAWRVQLHWGFPFVASHWEHFCHQVKTSGLASLKMRGHTENSCCANPSRYVSELSQHHMEQRCTIPAKHSPNCWPKQLGTNKWLFLKSLCFGVAYIAVATDTLEKPSYLTSLRPILSFLNGANFCNLGMCRSNEKIHSEPLA